MGAPRVRGSCGSADRSAAPVTQKQINRKKLVPPIIISAVSLSSALVSEGLKKKKKRTFGNMSISILLSVAVGIKLDPRLHWLHV